MSGRKFIVPEYGPLAGLRVVGLGSLIAMPFAATMMADFGAEVIQIERPGIGDTYRNFAPVKETAQGAAGASWIQDARNRLSFTLELDNNDPDVREIFLKLIAESDFFIENMVWLEKLGLSDKELLQVNPRLIIIHISGFGHEEFGGDPRLCEQASYDIIGQAFSGYVLFNMDRDNTPLVTKPSLNDYITALFALFGMMTSYISMEKTGRGQVVDVAQFEAQARVMRDAFTVSYLGLPDVSRSGTKATSFQPWDLIVSSDGEYVAVAAVGAAVYRRFLEAAGIDEALFPYEESARDRAAVESPKGRELDRLINEWCSSHTALEIEQAMSAHRVPCSRVNDANACMNNEHFLRRGDFVNFVDQSTGLDVKAFGIVPKLSETPGAIWRGGPSLGQDTHAVLRDLLGYTDQRITEFEAKGII